jgi:Cu/Ag efflux protein CusF
MIAEKTMWTRLLTLAMMCFVNPSSDAQSQPVPRRGMQFLGEVREINPAHKTIAVRHGPIPGYAPSGMDDYVVADDSMLKRLQPGDDIRATLYAEDHTLYNIKIVYRSNGDKKGGK